VYFATQPLTERMGIQNKTEVTTRLDAGSQEGKELISTSEL
jgi:hypothetical protein